MQSYGLPWAPVTNCASHLQPNDLRHRISTFSPQNYAHLPFNGVQASPLAQQDSPHWQPSPAQVPHASDCSAGELRVNVGPFFQAVTYGGGSTPADTSTSEERSRRPQEGYPRYRSPSPRNMGRSTSSRCRSRSRNASRSRSRSPRYRAGPSKARSHRSRSRTRSPCVSRSRSRSPRSKAGRSKASSSHRSRSRTRSPHVSRSRSIFKAWPSKARCLRRRARSPSPVTPSRPLITRNVLGRLPSTSNASKSSDVILQYYGVKVSNLQKDGLLLGVQDQVHSLFRVYGYVISTVATDDQDGRYAVVMYQSADSQAKAVEHGGVPIFGKPAQVVALSSEMTRTCFGVKVTTGLSPGLSEGVLLSVHNFFRMLGVVVSAKLYAGQEGRFVVLKFESQAEQTRALKANGKRILGIRMKVTALKASHSQHMALECERRKARANLRLRRSNDTNKSQSQGSSEETDRSQPTESRMLFVSNLDTNITKQDLSNTFGRYGEIVDIYINSLPGATHQFAFIQFALTPSVTSAILLMNGAFLGKCQIALSYGVIQPSRCVCVEGLSSSLNNEYLIQRFGEYGAIEKLLYDQTKGAALILYIEEDASQKAVNTTKQLNTTGETIVMDYANESFQLNFCQSLLASQGLKTPKT